MRQGRMRGRRWLISVGILWMLYGMAGNVFINTKLSSLISTNPEQLDIRWKWAITYFPGFAYVKDFRLRNQQADVQWNLKIDGAHACIALWSLLAHRFETLWVSAEGVDFRLRPRKLNDDTLAETVKPYAPIEGYADPPLRVYGAEPLLREDEFWSVRLRNVSVRQVRELWVAAYRAALEGEVRGNMALKTGSSLHVEIDEVSTVAGTLWQGEVQVLSNLRGRVSAALDAPGFPNLPPLALLQGLTVKAQLEADIPNVAFLNYHLRPVIHPELGGGEGTLKINGGFEQGKLSAGSLLQMGGKDMFAGFVGRQLRANWRLEGKTEPDGSAQAALSFSPILFEYARKDGQRIARSEGVRVTLAGRDVVLGAVPKEGVLTLDVDATEPFPLSALNGDIAGGEVRFPQGSATAKGHWELGPGSQKRGGALHIRAKDVEAHWGKSQLGGNVRIDIDLSRLQLLPQSVDFSGSQIELSNVIAKSARGRVVDWNGRIELPAVNFHLLTPSSATATVHAELSDARPFLTLFGDQAGIPRVLSPFLEAKDLTLKARLKVDAKEFVVKDLDMKGDGLSLEGDFDIAGEKVSAFMLLQVKFITVGLRVSPAGTDWKMLGATDWYKKQQTAGQTKHE